MFISSYQGGTVKTDTTQVKYILFISDIFSLLLLYIGIFCTFMFNKDIYLL